ncbi:MAG TPA: hypothetical protein VEK57_27135 [Thermoanaerobaculia bacterium]|nr:hypothetical protein [Thermoanaerobaculia bacterium]
MNCADCRDALEQTPLPQDVAAHVRECAGCVHELSLLQREDEVYAAYAARIEVPEMWGAVERRLRRGVSPWRKRVRWISLAAASLALIALAVITTSTRPPRNPVAVAVRAVPGPAGEAVARYRIAIARIEGGIRQRAKDDPRAAAAVAALPELTVAIGAAETGVAAAPADPIAVTRLVAAYDAKLEVLRGAAHVQ